MPNSNNNAYSLLDKTVVVTGGAGDIGLCTALHLGEQGASIGLLDIDEDKLADAVAKLRQKDIPCFSSVCDVTDSAQVDASVSAMVEHFGKIDCLFNNVGYQGDFAPTHHYSTDDFRRVFDINVVGAFVVLKAFAGHMVQHGGGAIVNTASMAATGGPPNMIAYASSKAALLGMTLTAAKDLAPHHVRVNAISPAYMGPGFMWTRQVEMQAKAGSPYFDSDAAVVEQQMINSIPMRRYGDIEEIPGTVAFLMSDASSYITGINVPISGGIV